MRSRFESGLPSSSAIRPVLMGTYVPIMPWEPHFTQEQAREAILAASSWRDVLEALEYGYHGKNIETVEHLSDHRGRPRRPRYSESELRDAVAASLSWAETLRRLGYCPTGGNWRTLKKRTADLGISTAHFDPYAAARGPHRSRRIPLDAILVEGSTYSRSNLKQRLYGAGLKKRLCELCGAGELWHGERMSLILDHVNGVRDDNRLANLRIVCPNCAATFATHCGRNGRETVEARTCVRCEAEFVPKYRRQRYCSRDCGTRWDRRGIKLVKARKVDRPDRQQLLREVDELGYCAAGRKYGVSDNAVRKWLRAYEGERLAAEGGSPDGVEIPTRTWPNRRR